MPTPEFALIECERLKQQHHWCSFAEFLPDNKTVVGFIGGQGFMLALWDAESGKKLKAADAAPYAPSSDFWISPDRRTLAFTVATTVLVNEDSNQTGAPVQYQSVGKTYIADTATLQIRTTLPYTVSKVAFSHDGTLMALAPKENTVRVITVQTNREVAVLKLDSFVGALAFRPDSEELWLVHEETVHTWNYRTSKVQKGAGVPGTKHAFSPDGKHLVYCARVKREFRPVVTDTTTWKSEEVSFTGKVWHLSLSPDATKLAIADDKTLVVWDRLEDRAWLKWKKPHYTDIRYAAFSPDGQRIASIVNHGQLNIFDFRAGAKAHALERPKPKAGELQCLRMVGPDEQMDRVEGHLEPLNPLPVACPACKRLNLDFVPSPYALGKKIESPVDLAPAVAGNLLVRESMKRVLEVAAPGLCKFYPTINRKTQQTTPWLLAVPQHTETTAEPSARKCPRCREPRNWEETEAGASPISKYEVFKARNSWQRDERNVYFSLRLETLVKKLGLRGMDRYIDCKDVPTADDLAWVEEKLRQLKQAGSKAVGAGKSDDSKQWFKDYVKENAKKNPAAHDFAAFEKKHRVKLPEAYKAFLSQVGPKSFQDVDGEEGFCVHILGPKKLKLEDCRERGTDEEATFKGLMFATTDHGDAFYFDLSRRGAEPEVRKLDHELDSYEPYARNFAAAVKRFAGA